MKPSGQSNSFSSPIIELTTCFHEFFEYDFKNYFNNISQLKKKINFSVVKKSIFFLRFEYLRKSKKKYYVMFGKVFTDRCRWQNFRPSLLRFVDRLYTVIHKMQKTRKKVLPSATVGE